jgi:uncharacterized membrane protein YdjX (TVP38/TMEM64 family)
VIKKTLRWIPLILIIIALICAIYFRLYEYISFETLAKHRSILAKWTAAHYFVVVICYMLIYIITVALSLPGATILTVTGGFLFGTYFGVVYVVISATIGACLIFLAVQTTLGEWLASKAHGWIRKMEEGFRKDAFNYLLFLRLVPLFPFWVVNIVPALLDVRLKHFALATLLGIIPGSLVYVLVGNGLDTLIASGQRPDLSIIFNPEILLPIVGLAILSLVPIIHKKIKKAKSQNE